jgi:hypothetical protein
MVNYDYNDDLNFWLINQRRYIYPLHLPIKLINDIFNELNYFWSNDKMVHFKKDNI